MKEQSNTQSMEERFKERFTYGVLYSASSDLSGGEGIDWRYPNMTPEDMLAFITSERELWKREIVEKIEQEIPDAWFPNGALHLKKRYLDKVLEIINSLK